MLEMLLLHGIYQAADQYSNTEMLIPLLQKPVRAARCRTKSTAFIRFISNMSPLHWDEIFCYGGQGEVGGKNNGI